MNYIALFSGQGAQYPGMGKELYEQFATAREVYQCASDILGYDLAKQSFTGTPEELAQTRVAQPAIFTLSLAAYRVFLQHAPLPNAVAGHSLGEYAALCAGGAFSLEDGMRIISKRAHIMETASNTAKGSMLAVMKLDAATIAQICAEVEGLVQPANLNLPDQTVISGETKAVEAAETLLKEQGARTKKLAVSSAFHSPIMAPAAKELEEALGSFSYHTTSIPFFSNVTGTLTNFSEHCPNYPTYFAEHMVKGVQFTQEMQSMLDFGMKTAIEFGPKKTVAGLVKKFAPQVSTTNVEDTVTLEQAAAIFG